jgi:hypothetical protein
MGAHEVASGYLVAVGAVGLFWAVRAVGWRRILDSYRRHE